MDVFIHVNRILYVGAGILLCAFFATQTHARHNGFDRDEARKVYEQQATSTESDFNTPEEETNAYWNTYRELESRTDALPQERVSDLIVPIALGVELDDLFPNFGDPRDGGARTHQGLDILAPDGTPIASPTDAVVLRIGFGNNSGNHVYTANPGGERLAYFHLASVASGLAAGTVLKPGDIVGYVGNTGNASGGAAHLHFEIRGESGITNPYPRLTRVFSTRERVTVIEKALALQSDKQSYAAFLVENFSNTFKAAVAESISLPQEIVAALAANPDTAVLVQPAPTGGVPVGDLELGARGGDVTLLQQLLIARDAGIAAKTLASHGTTGYFGQVTQAALIEYQRSRSISPPSGYYGPVTRAKISAEQHTTPAPGTNPDTGTGTSYSFTRDLELGDTGEDVRALQRFLNKNLFPIAASGPGSTGNETDYFGPATRSALISFQVAKGIVPAAGYFGPLTRKTILAF